MGKTGLGLTVLSVLLMAALAGCGGNPPSSSQAPPEEYVKRYPGEYYTELSDYSSIHVEDKDGGDISPIAIDLWYAANEIYDVDDMKMFDMEYSDTILHNTAYNELYNYDAVVGDVFTQAAIAQLEGAGLNDIMEPLIVKQDGKTYRKAPYKTGYSYSRALTDMQVKERTGERVTLAVTYTFTDHKINDDVPADFTIANVDGIWLVDDYVCPGTHPG